MKPKKVIKKLEARIKAFESIPGKEHLRGQGLMPHKPGSQNYRKG